MSHNLGPHLVGRRLVVRLRTRDGVTDVLGELERWDDLVHVRRADGSLAVFPPGAIVTGKPVPPRGSVRQRLSPAEVERRTGLGWRAPDEQTIGAWTLRAANGFTGRANSVLVGGDPGLPFGDALAAAVAFYRARGLPPLAQVPFGDDPGAGDQTGFLADFERYGWVPARPGEADVLVQVASVSQLTRGLRDVAVPDVVLHPRLVDSWLDAFPRERDAGPAAVSVLSSGEHVVFAELPGRAWARASLARDWVGITNVLVLPGQRRQGLATALLAAVARWAAELGASTAYVQVLADNTPALQGYAARGFRTHHRYRYLTPAS